MRPPIRWPTEAERLARRINAHGSPPGWDEGVFDPDDVDDPDLVGPILLQFAAQGIAVTVAFVQEWSVAITLSPTQTETFTGLSLPRLLLRAWMASTRG